jgi:predicted amidohydrolase
MSLSTSIAENRDRIVAAIARAATRRVRVAVFPESALRGTGAGDPALAGEAVAAIRRAAREHDLYVLFGGASPWPASGNELKELKELKEFQWLHVIGPDGNDVFHYDKLYDRHDAKPPAVFRIDGVPCSAFLCADRWLRGVEEIPIQQGAQISFELSCNFAQEWVEPYEWYWYAPRALRNNVWVIFANTGNKAHGVPDGPDPRELRHGHSAIIAPDGRIAAASRDDVEAIVVADLDVSQATRAEALARAAHPALRAFWEAGCKLQGGQGIEAPAVTALESPESDITLAVAQVTDDIDAVEAMIGQAAAKHADLVVFPERAILESALGRVQAAARRNTITVVVGAEHRADGGWRNAAFVLGPDGSVLTRHDQLSATGRYLPGTDPRRMWFRVKGVPAAVTVGRDALWTELAELAAVAGAQILVHIDRDGATSEEAELRRLQVRSNFASFHTFTATANVIDSAIWDDLSGNEERSAVVSSQTRPGGGAAEVFSPFSADLVVRAGAGPRLISATRRVRRWNPHHPGCTSRIQPQMDAWYRLGAGLIAPRE